jgi:hypothetical protein
MPIKNPNKKLNDSKDLPKIKTLTEPKAIKQYGGTRMLIAAPLEYDALMKKIPCGKVITSDRLRDYLAKKHDADFTCALTAGIFINTAAYADIERNGVDETPWWRTLKKDGELNPKYPEGIDGQKIRLEKEGHQIIQKGKRSFVDNYEQKLIDLTNCY